jgi:hypothetical protein
MNFDNRILIGAFDCRITPVFTMEGEAPVFLDDIVLTKADREKKLHFSHQRIARILQ